MGNKAISRKPLPDFNKAIELQNRPMKKPMATTWPGVFQRRSICLKPFPNIIKAIELSPFCVTALGNRAIAYLSNKKNTISPVGRFTKGR